ncbi:MAG: hypothetical protein M3Y18_07170 [Candidatus Eremiobacteraeota bacterium]|nr:hypothetical protein [Candidatus Eremiobacteraeota bacterium]
MWKRIGAFVVSGLLVWGAAEYLSAQSACAHDPRFPCSPRGANNPVLIPDAGKSWAYYGTLPPGGTDRYEFDLATASIVPVNLLVDLRDAGNRARPELSIQRGGVRVAHIDFSRSRIFYEPFSRETYVATPVRDLKLGAGHYIATVTMWGSMPQRYTVALGGAEKFSVFEIPYVLGAIHRIRALRF